MKAKPTEDLAPNFSQPVQGTWNMELLPWPYGWNQMNDPTADGRPDENKANNCGPESVAEVIYHLSGVVLPADFLKDTTKGEAFHGYTSLADLQLMLSRVARTHTGIETPANKQDWLRRVWTHLLHRHPMIGLFSFSAPGAPDGHFRPITGMTPTQVITSDPGKGTRRAETYDLAYSWAKGPILHVPRARAPQLDTELL